MFLKLEQLLKLQNCAGNIYVIGLFIFNFNFSNNYMKTYIQILICITFSIPHQLPPVWNKTYVVAASLNCTNLRAIVTPKKQGPFAAKNYASHKKKTFALSLVCNQIWQNLNWFLVDSLLKNKLRTRGMSSFYV